MKELITQIKPKYHSENATMNVYKEGKTVHIELHDDTGEYAEMWIDYEDVIQLHKYLNEFINNK